VPTALPPSPFDSPAPLPVRRPLGSRLRGWLPPAALAGTLARGLGAVLVVAALGVTGWTLWERVGTEVVAERGQASRTQQLEALEAAMLPGESPAAAGAPGDAQPAGERAGVVGRLTIPSIGVDEVVAAGTDVGVLNGGPGLWEDGVLPGLPGNATIAGHRNTYGSSFYYLDRLAPGDRIVFEAPGRPPAVFEVRGSAVVAPWEVGVTAQGPGVRLTLTTCTPIGTAESRLIVQAELVEGEFAAQALPADGWAFRNDS
jgi:sortase A